MSNKLVLTSGDKSLPDSSSFPKIQTSKLALCLRRANSMIDQPKSSPEQAKPVSNFPDFTSPVSRASFKRPADPCSSQKELMKKPRKTIESPCPISKASIEKRMFCNADSQNLTADGSRQLLLPTVLGNANNRDLNNIDCHALAELINGRFDDEVCFNWICLKSPVKLKWIFLPRKLLLPHTLEYSKCKIVPISF